MRETRTIMGMAVTIAIPGALANTQDIETVFEQLVAVDNRFSPYKSESELSRFNRGEIKEPSVQMREIFALAEKAKADTYGYFDIVRPDHVLDPCGIVKGWAIRNAAESLAQMGYENFFVEAGGDIQTSGQNEEGREWRVGIRNPFKADEIVKVVYAEKTGVATSGTYFQGSHIYNPHAPDQTPKEIVSLTVIGPDVLQADCYATAAFAMGRNGIFFIERLPGFEAYEINMRGIARMTTGLGRYLTC